MKNKVITYLLLAIVLIVWGIIFNKVFKVNNEELFVYSKTNVTKNSDTLIPIQKYQLKLNYTEPFLGTSNQVKKQITSKPKVLKLNTPFPIENFSYLGMIKNTRKKSTLAIVKWKGLEAYLAIGEKIDNIQVIKIDNSFVELRVDGVNYKVMK